MGRDQQSAQLFVMVAMGLVTGSIAAGMYTHGGIPAPVAASAALAIYVLLLTVHALVWRSGASRTSASPAGADSRNPAIRKLRDGSAEGAQPHVGSPRGASGADRRVDARQSAQAPAAARVAPSAHEDSLLLREALAPRPAAARQEPPLSGAARGLMTGNPEPQSIHDYWSFRPAAPRLEVPQSPSGRAGEGASDARGLPLPGGEAHLAPPRVPQKSSAPREADVEIIQDAIKRLLQEVNAAETQSAAPPTTKAEPTARPSRAAAPAAHAPQAVPPPPPPALDGSIEALRIAAQTMRAAQLSTAAPLPSAPSAASESLPAWTAPPGITPRVRAIADAITAGRIDVSLEPIMSLEDQRTRHYEVSIRLRNEMGEPLAPYGEGVELRGTGLLPLFDSANVTRTAAMARRLEERGKPGSVFSAFNGESLTDDRFLGNLAETLHQRSSFATQLVLSFTQSDVRDFAPSEWDTLADMRSLGFRFALSGVTHLDMDFEALAEAGFTFVKLDADVFLRGLPTSGGHIPASDICRHLAKLGLTLVVEHIDDPEKLARIFGFGVLLGQGQLFGGPRPVKAQAVAAPGHAAA